MKKEQIAFGNGTKLDYDSIGTHEGRLVIGFNEGDAAALESAFRAAGQDGLETITQMGADGEVQTEHKYYDILSAVNKEIGTGGSQTDVVRIVLLHEGEANAKIRHLEARLSAAEDTADMLVMDALSTGKGGK